MKLLLSGQDAGTRKGHQKGLVIPCVLGQAAELAHADLPCLEKLQANQAAKKSAQLISTHHAPYQSCVWEVC